MCPEIGVLDAAGAFSRFSSLLLLVPVAPLTRATLACALCAADLAGGCLAALLGAAFLAPVLGIP